jgi:hypothetical protein
MKKHIRSQMQRKTECGRDINTRRPGAKTTNLTKPDDTSADVCHWCRVTYDSRHKPSRAKLDTLRVSQASYGLKLHFQHRGQSQQLACIWSEGGDDGAGGWHIFRGRFRFVPNPDDVPWGSRMEEFDENHFQTLGAALLWATDLS